MLVGVAFVSISDVSRRQWQEWLRAVVRGVHEWAEQLEFSRGGARLGGSARGEKNNVMEGCAANNFDQTKEEELGNPATQETLIDTQSTVAVGPLLCAQQTTKSELVLRLPLLRRMNARFFD